MKQWELIRREGAEHVCNNLVPAGGPSDTEANSEEFSRSQMFDNRLHTMVASVTPFYFEFDAAEMKIEIVMGDDQIGGRYREMRTQVCHCLAASIHIGQRQGEHDRLRFDRALPIHCRRELVPQDNMIGCPQAVDYPETYIMAGVSIARARIAQPHDQFHIGSPRCLPSQVFFRLCCGRRALGCRWRSGGDLFTTDADGGHHLIGGGQDLNPLRDW